MKSQTFTLNSAEARASALSLIGNIEPDGKFEVVVRDRQRSKTMQQLGALFGLWYRHISDQTGYGEMELHNGVIEDGQVVQPGHKRMFLEGIYRRDPQSGDQMRWLESIAYHHLKGNHAEVEKRRRQISLSWATVKQMSEYMNMIEEHYQSNGIPLPIPGEYEKVYETSTKNAA